MRAALKKEESATHLCEEEKLNLNAPEISRRCETDWNDV